MLIFGDHWRLVLALMWGLRGKQLVCASRAMICTVRQIAVLMGAASGLLIFSLPLAVASASPKPAGIKSLMRSFEIYQKEIDQLNLIAPPLSIVKPEEQKDMSPLLRGLPAPAAGTLPDQPNEVAIQRKVSVDLQEALALAVNNDPKLKSQIAFVDEQRATLRSIRGRFFPILSLDLGGGYGQRFDSNQALQGNEAIYSPNSAFYVPTGGTNSYQTNLLTGLAGLRVDYELISFERDASLGKAEKKLLESEQLYGSRLRQLQLDVSQAYYALQLADQLVRIRQVVVNNDTLIRDQILQIKAVGLVPRIDVLRADSVLEQSRFRLMKAKAIQKSSQRRLSNLINVPFDVTLVAKDAVRLQPPWPLNLEQTIIKGFQDNPSLQAIQAARAVLLKEADRQAAELLPTLRLFIGAGYSPSQINQSNININNCCGQGAVIPSLQNQQSEWAAGLRMNWRLFDAGITSGQVAATKAAAEQSAQAEAEERNAIRQRLETAYFDHTAALEQIGAANSSFRAAREAYRDARARYEFGLANYTDLSDTVTKLTIALEQRAEAVTDANLSYAQLLRELLPVPTKPSVPVLLPLTLANTP